MTETKNEAKRVTINLPYPYDDGPKERYVAINGVDYLIPKGQNVSVPDFVAEEIRRADAAQKFVFEDKHRRIEDAKKIRNT